MAITGITKYSNHYDPANPVASAYAYLAGLGLDASTGTGTVVYNVHPNANAWTGTPLGQVKINLGDVLVPASGTTPAVTMPTLSGLLALSSPTLPTSPTINDLYNAIGKTLDGYAVHHPLFAGGIVSGAD